MQDVVKLLFLSVLLTNALAQPLPKIVVSENHRFFVTEEGVPFFWLADTVWELFHRCTREEAKMYFETRSRQGFNVVQAVALAELNGLIDPNQYGDTPLIDHDPRTPNPIYFNHVDEVINLAAEYGIYIALLPTWGDKVNKRSWGVGPEIFNVNNAYDFGKWIGNRYKDFTNIIWIMGGDRNPREEVDDAAVWRALATGVTDGVGGHDKVLMSFHPQPKENGGSSTWFHRDAWLDFNMHQTGHCPNHGTYIHIRHDYGLVPTKPVLDGEPLYEDHPNCFRPQELGHSVPEDIRRIMYWNVFAGACGQSYGCHAVWQMFKPGREPINYPLRPWDKALDLPMAKQVKHLKNLMLSRPYFTKIPDETLIPGSQPDEQTYVIGTRDSDGSYAMVYTPTGERFEMDCSSITGDTFHLWWYDVRTGAAIDYGIVPRVNRASFTPPAKENDWVLVIDDSSRDYGKPGIPIPQNQ